MNRISREEGIIEDVPQSQLGLLARTAAEDIAVLTEKQGVLPTSTARHEVRRPAVLNLLDLVVRGGEKVAATIVGIPTPS